MEAPVEAPACPSWLEPQAKREWKRIVPELEASGEPALEHDSSTNALIRRYRNARGEQ